MPAPLAPSRVPEAIAGKTYAVGIVESDRKGMNVPAGANYMVLRLARDSFDSLIGGGAFEYSGCQDPFTKLDYKVGGQPNEVARAYVLYSPDGGNTWQHGGYFGLCGGNHVFRNGQLATETTFSNWIPDWQSSKRQIRVVLEVRKEVRTKINVEFLTLPAMPWVLADDHHSVAVNGASTGAQATAATSVGTGSLAPSGSNRLLFISGGNSAGGGGQAVTFAWNGGSITAENWDVQAQSFFACAGGYLLNPAASSASGTMTVGATADELCAGAVAMDGVDQTTPVAGAANNNGGASASTVTTGAAAAVGDMVIDTVYHYDTTYTANQSQTARWDEQNINGGTCGACGTKAGAGSTVTMGYAQPAGAAWIIGAVVIKQDTGGGGPPFPPVPGALITPNLASLIAQ